jgi:Ca-activated chloride channel family protein
MTFQWPELLWLMLAVPALAAAYVVLLRKRRKLALQYASLSLVREANALQTIRRHIPPLLLLLALALMIAATARPSAVLTLPSQHETVILAMDVSGSMRATDVQPTRLAAAQAAAKTFVAEQSENVRIGVVAFAGTATVAQAPTRNREDVLAAIERFQLQRATAIGSAIVVSLATLFPDAGIDLAALTYGGEGRKPLRPPPPPFKPVPPGSYTSGVIVLLTDGQRTTGPDSIQMARLAAERGVRIFTVGVGTPKGTIVGIEGWSMRVGLDEETLKAVADITRGEYFYAGTAVDLKKIYESLRSRLVLERKRTEVTALFAAAAALLVVVSAALSLAWFNRIL